jgi:hypothetical protein
MEVKNVAHCVFMAPDPKLLTIDFEDLAKRHKQRIEEREKANPPKPEPMRVEYNRLRKQLYELQQASKSAEVYCNNKADAVKGIEHRINDLLKAKKQAIADGHLGDERKYENQLQLRETELIDAQEEFAKAKRWSVQAARVKKEFEFNENGRIAELKALLDALVPGAKSDNIPK